MTFAVGDSYFHLRRSDRERPAHSVFTPHMEWLDTRVCPLEKQCRVFVGDTEYEWYDDTSFVRPTSDYWTYTPPSTATGGVACWGVRFLFDPVGSGINDDIELVEIAVWDGEGNLIPCKDNWSEEDELEEYGGDTVDNDELSADVFDLSSATADSFNGTFERRVSIRFPQALVVSKVGWTSRGTGASSSDYIQNMEFQVNTGTPNRPVWVSMGSNLTQAVGNAGSHNAGEELNQSDYPAVSGTIDPDTELLTLSVPAASYGGTLPHTITLSAALPNESDRLTIIRETRQDRAWVKPTGAAYAVPEQFMVYFNQLRFIVQELCEIQTIVDLAFTLPLAELVANDYTHSSQAQFHTGGGTTLSYADIELLDGLPGSPGDDRWQLEVAVGNQSDGTSSIWTVLTYDAAPADETEYSVDSAANTITLGDAESNDIRIRRVTRTYKWWYDPQGTRPGWNSLGVNTMQKQTRFMLEESCFLPIFYLDSPLSNSIFPRNWNWFVFVGTINTWIIPGGTWGGSGETVIINNNVVLIEGVEYIIEWPGVIFFPPSGGSGGFGGGGFGGGGMGGGDDDEEPTPPTPPPPQGGPTVEWPGFSIPASYPISVSIGSTHRDVFSGGTWEGETNINLSQGNGFAAEFNDHAIRIECEVTDPDGFADSPLGAKEVIYINKQCNETTVYRLATAADTNADGTWDASDEGNAGLGCLGGAASLPLGLWAAFNATQSGFGSSDHPFFQMAYHLLSNLDGAIANGEVANAAFFNAWAELTAQSIDAEAAGVVGASGFTAEQFQQYLDPDEDFTEFDIPPA